MDTALLACHRSGPPKLPAAHGFPCTAPLLERNRVTLPFFGGRHVDTRWFSLLVRLRVHRNVVHTRNLERSSATYRKTLSLSDGSSTEPRAMELQHAHSALRLISRQKALSPRFHDDVWNADGTRECATTNATARACRLTAAHAMSARQRSDHLVHKDCCVLHPSHEEPQRVDKKRISMCTRETENHVSDVPMS